MRINFVMSNTVQSGIFTAIIGYFKKYLPANYELYVTEHPLDNMDIYHYHRPNLEKSLKENSVVTVHHDLEDTDPWFHASEFIDRYHEADKIICLNSLQSKFLIEQEELENTVIIPHGVDKNIFKRKEYKENTFDKLKIAVVSKRYARRVKGEALMLELYKRLNPEKIAFYFLGEGRSVDKVEAESYGFESYCFEYLPYKMFNNFYQNIDILLIASLYEGGPANLPEALYCNIPVISREIAMMKDYIKEGVNGFFLTGDPSKDSELINKLASNNDDSLSKIFKSISENTVEILDWKDVVDKHIEVYKEIYQKGLVS